MKQSPQEKSLTKEFSLTKEETSNLGFRHAVIEYLTQVITADITAYTKYNILPRLSIKDKNFTINKDNTVLTLVGGEDDSAKAK